MTAEIAVMNKQGIALAADSAVTIGNSKVLSTNKLFMLSKYYPVGIMVFGNASLLGVPWEILIKQYKKKELGKDSFNSLTEYGEHLIDYLNGNTFYFPKDLQLRSLYYILETQRELLLDEYQDRLFKFLRTEDGDDIKKLWEKFKPLFINLVEEKLSGLKSLSAITSFKITKTKFNKQYKFLVDDFIKKMDDHPTVVNDIARSKHLKNNLKEIAYLAVVKNTFASNDNLSGVVVAGYGEKEIYPSLIAYDIETIIENKLKYVRTDELSVDNSNKAYVKPFAQEDMVKTFMDGVSPENLSFFGTILEEIIADYPDAVMKKLVGKLSAEKRKKFAESLKQVGSTFIQGKKKEIAEFIRDYNNRPITQSVATLPIEELAQMAQAFVNLTSFKRRVTPVLETVGEPIDVAVITKGDGFIWIERKHYFKSERNPHFFSNYYRGGH